MDGKSFGGAAEEFGFAARAEGSDAFDLSDGGVRLAVRDTRGVRRAAHAREDVREVARLGLLKPGGWVVVEVGRREALPAEVPALKGTLVRVREDVYGDTLLALYEARAAGQPGVDAKPAVEAGRGVAAESIVAMEEER